MAYFEEQLGIYTVQISIHNDAVSRDFDETTLGIITDYKTIEQAQEAYLANHTQLVADLKVNYQEWEAVSE